MSRPTPRPDQQEHLLWDLRTHTGTWPEYHEVNNHSLINPEMPEYVVELSSWLAHLSCFPLPALGRHRPCQGVMNSAKPRGISISGGLAVPASAVILACPCWQYLLIRSALLMRLLQWLRAKAPCSDSLASPTCYAAVATEALQDLQFWFQIVSRTRTFL